MSERIKPFTKDHVLRLTTKNMRRHIDVSIRKTFDRMKDFPEGPKSAEIFETLALLHSLRKNLDDFQHIHSKHFSQPAGDITNVNI